jgi:hypothetical protein
MLRRVALVRTDVSEELSASFIRVTRIVELEITLAVTSNRRHAAKKYHYLEFLEEALSSSEMSVLTRATWRNIPEDAILQDFIYDLSGDVAEAVNHRLSITAVRVRARAMSRMNCG